MLIELEHRILEIIQHLFEKFGWLGIAGLMSFENATSIMPSEVVLGISGWVLLALRDAPPYMVFIAGLYAALGSLLGSSLVYWVVRLGGRPLVDRMVSLLKINPRYIQQSETQFRRWGMGIVLFGRVIPAVRFLVTIPAGLARMPYGLFSAFTFVGSYIWCTLLIGLGYVLGHRLPSVSEYITNAGPWALAAFVLAGAIFLLGPKLVKRLRLKPVAIPIDEE